MKINKKYIKLVIFIIIITVCVALNNKYGWSKYLTNIDNLKELSEYVHNHFLVSALIYVVLTMVGCCVLALPGFTLAIFAGVLFGPILGTLLCLVATTLGAMMSFLAGRYFIKDAVKPLIKKNKTLYRLLFEEFDKNEMVILMITRMIPLFTYNLQNYAYGVTNISFYKYSLYTFIFMIPGVAAFTIGAAGITAGENKWKYYLIAIILCLIVSGLAIFIKKKYGIKDEKDAKEYNTID